jgi:hypothetical protein
MHEDILAAIGRGNETEALGVVEPLYCTCIHENTSVWLNCDVLQFIPESDRGSNCRRNWEELPNCLQEVRCNPGTIQEWKRIARVIFGRLGRCISLWVAPPPQSLPSFPRRRGKAGF